MKDKTERKIYRVAKAAKIVVGPIQFDSKWRKVLAKNLRRACGVATFDAEHIIIVGGKDENYGYSNAVTLVNIKTG
eukprot:CAMPEP_0194047010 /NCGR_PEP_ID=MMETSP0009_2-20130614/23397_1 /TAXON_ID=210454 /ORGANISM="Grammatophora oceanica, Strain CCMP 410" /LENGTH=75 /DNA_ID=CAMNT_0038692515 /DNA_START=50 /DNA_END=274 /DNA_ORIENTATION=+